MIYIKYPTKVPTFLNVWGVGMISVDDLSVVENNKFDEFEQGPKQFGQHDVLHRKVEGSVYANPYSSYTSSFRQPSGMFAFTGISPWGNQDFVVDKLPGMPVRRSFVEYGSWYSNEHIDGDDRTRDVWSLTNYGRATHLKYSIKKMELTSEGFWSVTVELVHRLKEGFVPSEEQQFEDVSQAQLESYLGSGDRLVEKRIDKTNYVPFTYKGSESWLPSLNLRDLQGSIAKFVRNASLSPAPLPEIKGYGDLAMDAANNRFAITENFLESAIGLLSMKSLIKSLTSKISKLKDLPKEAANKFLALSYGVLPMQSDFEAIIKAVNRIPHQDRFGYRVESATDTAFGNGIRHTRRVHLSLSGPGPEITNPFRNAGFALTPENLWNIVPYSFVVDWFVDISAILSDIQTHSDFVSLPVAYAMTSDKIIRDLVINEENCTGNLEIIAYSRQISENPPQPNYIGSSMSSPSAHKNWLEGSALIFQRKLK